MPMALPPPSSIHLTVMSWCVFLIAFDSDLRLEVLVLSCWALCRWKNVAVFVRGFYPDPLWGLGLCTILLSRVYVCCVRGNFFISVRKMWGVLASLAMSQGYVSSRNIRAVPEIGW